MGNILKMALGLFGGGGASMMLPLILGGVMLAGGATGYFYIQSLRMELRGHIRDERRRWCLALAAEPPQPVIAYRANVEQDTDKFFSLTGQDFVISPCSDFTRQEKDMLTAIFWFTVGLLIGWNVIPQPAWVRDRVLNLWDRITWKK